MNFVIAALIASLSVANARTDEKDTAVWSGLPNEKNDECYYAGDRVQFYVTPKSIDLASKMQDTEHLHVKLEAFPHRDRKFQFVNFTVPATQIDTSGNVNQFTVDGTVPGIDDSLNRWIINIEHKETIIWKSIATSPRVCVKVASERPLTVSQVQNPIHFGDNKSTPTTPQPAPAPVPVPAPVPSSTSNEPVTTIVV